ncbi:MarR family transcriptional regulator [Rhodoferax sp.]|uniref:MarR family winged helix-turn-helix transcriptional regulator n=1 Tax=Rhodoferax sp. TaxID=50421 RepID=UPI0025F32771|nr:MarR family transcriptional regulator [Rhodoferax sp.]
MKTCLTAQDSAAKVMDVVPAVMDAIRTSMRHGVEGSLSVPQFRCLNFISRRPGCAMGDIAVFLGVTMPTASAMADRLVQAGLVQPQTATGDRRCSRLETTTAGVAQLAAIQNRAQGELKAVLAVCTPQEQQTLQAGLAVLWRIFRPLSESTEPIHAP